VPLSTLAYSTLDRSKTAEAAGLFSLVRTLGAAIGISVVSTVLTRQAQVVWNELGANVHIGNAAVTQQLRGLGLDPSDPHGVALLAARVAQQSQIVALLDVFALITWSFLAMLPLILLMRRQASTAPN
jgi:MFS transporter, DHA2 family, multidrug resistance protein